MAPLAKPTATPETLEFCDLSADLDRLLRFLADLSEEEYQHYLQDYLGKRAALEHVFFGRYVQGLDWDELKLKAEIWRLRKLKARANLSR